MRGATDAVGSRRTRRVIKSKGFILDDIHDNEEDGQHINDGKQNRRRKKRHQSIKNLIAMEELKHFTHDHPLSIAYLNPNCKSDNIEEEEEDGDEDNFYEE
ncbi:hypothetical protein Tco_0058019 [Tanacetum coccineum]